MKRAPAAAVLILSALLPGRATAAATHQVSVEDFAFAPSQVTADIGDSVRWDWSSGFHSVVEDATDTEICSARFAPTPSCSFDLPSSGPFLMRYHCGIHPSMTGIVTTDRPPSIQVSSPGDGGIVISPVAVTGTATDDGTIAAVEIVTMTQPLGLLARTDGAACMTGCGTGSIGWSVDLDLLPGRYSLTATVTDNAGLKTTTRPMVIVVL